MKVNFLKKIKYIGKKFTNEISDYPFRGSKSKRK